MVPAPIKVMAHEGAYLCGQSERRQIKITKRRKAYHMLLNLYLNLFQGPCIKENKIGSLSANPLKYLDFFCNSTRIKEGFQEKQIPM
jgi:hypothetical protein